MIILLMGIFVTELIKYGVWFKYIHELNFKRLGTGSALAGLFVLSVITGVINEHTALLVWNLTVILLYTVVIECDKGERELLIIQAAFVIIGMDEIVGGVLKLIKSLPIQNAVLNKENYIQGNVVIILLLSAAGILKEKIRKRLKPPSKHSKWINISIVIMAASVFLVITGFQSISQYYAKDGIRLFSRIISMISFVCIGCFAVIINYVFHENKRYRVFLEQEELLLKTQKNIYDVMVAKNEKIRAFQHDVKNHFMYLEELAQNGSVDKIQEYIRDIEGQLGAIDKRIYLVGNSVMDAVLNYYLPLLEDGVRVQVTGTCAARVRMSEAELCTVFSNLILNAIEAIRSMRDEEERCFRMDLAEEKNYMVLRIRNTYSGRRIILDEKHMLPKTSKNDSREHGIGLKNVKETVKKNGGIFSIDVEAKVFQVSLMLPLEAVGEPFTEFTNR